MKKTWLNILFWGSLWGAAEATIGYLLHMASIALPGLPGFFLFPMAYFFVRRAVLSTGKASSAFAASSVAALLKLLDLLVPGNIPIRILNPALSILMEGAVAALIFALAFRKGKEPGAVWSFGMGVAWRGLFLGYLAVISLFGLPAALVTDGFAVSLRFLLLESLVNSALIFLYLKLERKPKLFEVKPSTLTAALCASVLLQFLF